MSETTISHVRVAAAHDGVAELVVTLTHTNGGSSEVALDQMAVSALMQSCMATQPQELVGKTWEKVRDALSVSYNRYNAST